MTRMLTMVAVCILAVGAEAQQKSTFRYDALGRLIESDQRRITGGSAFSVYRHDASSNRRRVEVTTTAHNAMMAPDTFLRPGQQVTSPDARFRLTLQYDGNVVLYDQQNVLIWNTGTNGSGADTFVMQTDGNLVLYRQGQALWHTHTYMYAGSSLHIQNDGNVVVYDSGGTARWASNTCCR